MLWDLLRNVIIFSSYSHHYSLRVFIYTPYRLTEQDSNAYLAKKLTLGSRTRKQDIKRGDFFVLYMDGKDYVGRVAQKKIRVNPYDDPPYLNGQSCRKNTPKRMREKYLASAGSSVGHTHDLLWI